MKKSLLLLVAALATLVASAHDFEVDGICYNITSEADKTVEVTYKAATGWSDFTNYVGIETGIENPEIRNHKSHTTSTDVAWTIPRGAVSTSWEDARWSLSNPTRIQSVSFHGGTLRGGSREVCLCTSRSFRNPKHYANCRVVWYIVTIYPGKLNPKLACRFLPRQIV